eukprot:6203177-Pleurochrysis_carterae.AAC.2
MGISTAAERKRMHIGPEPRSSAAGAAAQQVSGLEGFSAEPPCPARLRALTHQEFNLSSYLLYFK